MLMLCLITHNILYLSCFAITVYFSFELNNTNNIIYLLFIVFMIVTILIMVMYILFYSVYIICNN